MLMQEPELELEHTLKSVAMSLEIRRLLTTTFDEQSEWSNEVIALINCIEDILKHTPDDYVPTEWRLMVAGLHVLASQITCERIAEGGGNLTEEDTKCRTLLSKLRRLLSSDNLKLTNSTDTFHHAFRQTGQCNSDELHTFLSSIPLPALYWHSRELTFPFRDSNKESENPPNPLLRVILFLDHAPVASPQLLKPNVLYPLVFRVRGLAWLKDAVRLKLDLLTTCPQNEFSVSEFILEPPRIENDEYQGELKGNISFKSGQSSWLDDLVFNVRGAFEMPDGSFKEIPVIGHNELRFKVVSEAQHPLMTGNRRLDEYVEELVTKLLKDCPKVRDELPDLLPMLEALTRLRAIYAQEAIWKGQNDVSESDFQTTVLRDLRNALSQDVQEHPNQAGGSTDIRYRGVIVELKVEKKNGNREHIAKKYTAQTVQYAGVEARQLSILLVLDLTNKDKPTGDIRNDIFLKDVETHGGDDDIKEFSSKAFVFVVNGNMKSPSSYSR